MPRREQCSEFACTISHFPVKESARKASKVTAQRMTRECAIVFGRLRCGSRASVAGLVSVEKPMCIIRNVRTLIAAPRKRASLA